MGREQLGSREPTTLEVRADGRVVHVEGRASRGSSGPKLQLLHLGRHVLLDAVGGGCDPRGHSADHAVCLGGRVPAPWHPAP